MAMWCAGSAQFARSSEFHQSWNWISPSKRSEYCPVHQLQERRSLPFGRPVNLAHSCLLRSTLVCRSVGLFFVDVPSMAPHRRKCVAPMGEVDIVN